MKYVVRMPVRAEAVILVDAASAREAVREAFVALTWQHIEEWEAAPLAADVERLDEGVVR